MSVRAVNTVTGSLEADELGVTPMHEHLLTGDPGRDVDLAADDIGEPR